MKSRLEPMKRVARMLRNHRGLILNWFRAKKAFSSGIVEGLNGKAKVVTKRAHGFRTFDHLQVALYHTLGDLPEPKVRSARVRLGAGSEQYGAAGVTAQTWHRLFFFSDLTAFLEHLEPYERV